MIWPATGYSAGDLVNALTNVNNISQPITAGAHGAVEVIDKYLRWANDASRMLGSALRKSDLDRLVLTPRYWATLANPDPTAPVQGAVNQEAQDRARDIDAAWREAQELMRHWAADPHGTHFVVPDTGVFLNHEPDENGRFDIGTIPWRTMVPARTFEEVRVVVPILVIDELERIKDNRGLPEAKRSKARWTVDTMFKWFETGPNRWHILRQPSADSGGIAIELLPDERGHVRLPRNDDEPVDRAAVLKDLQGSPVHFLAYDAGAILRANMAGVTGVRLNDQQKPERASTGAP